MVHANESNNFQHCWRSSKEVMHSGTIIIILAMRVRRHFLKAHAIERSIVGPNMLRPFAWNHNNVGTCCV